MKSARRATSQPRQTSGSDHSLAPARTLELVQHRADLRVAWRVGHGSHLLRTSAEGLDALGVLPRSRTHVSSYNSCLTDSDPITFYPPSELSAVAVNSTQIRLTWKDNSSDEQAFVIYRRIAKLDWGFLATITAARTTFLARIFNLVFDIPTFQRP